MAKDPEQAMWQALRPIMLGTHAVRIESSSTGAGIPDVECIFGWMELKYLDKWPARCNTKIRIKHFTKEQRSWLLLRERLGEATFLMVKIGKMEWWLFRGSMAAIYIGELNKVELSTKTVARWNRKPKRTELIQCLKENSSRV